MQTKSQTPLSARPEMLVTLKTMRKHLQTLRKNFRLFKTEPQLRCRRLNNINMMIATIFQQLPLLEAQNTHKNTHAITRLERQAYQLISDLERRLLRYGLVREVDGIVQGEGRGWGGLGRSRPAAGNGRDTLKMKEDVMRTLKRIAQGKAEEKERKARLRRSKRVAKSKAEVTEEDEIEVTDEDEDWGDNDKREPERDYIPLFDVGIHAGNRSFVNEDMEMSDEDDNDYIPPVNVRREEKEKNNQLEVQHEQMDRSDKEDDDCMLSVIRNEELKNDRTEIVDLIMDIDQSEEDDDCTITLVINRIKSPQQNRTEHEIAAENIIQEYHSDYYPAIDRKKRAEESWIELGMVLKDELLWCDPRNYFDEDLLA